MSGRPLRFLGAVLLLWVTLRVAFWWPDGPSPTPVIAERTGPSDETASFLPLRFTAVDRPNGVPRAAVRAIDRSLRASVPSSAIAPGENAFPVETPPLERVERSTIAPRSNAAALAPSVAPPVLPPSTRAPDRFALSIWGIARDGRSDTLATGQLGASQVGTRATYTIDTRARLALAGRISAPLRGRGREAAIGIDWQPVDAPVHIIAEQRLPIDGGAERPAVFAAAGFDNTLLRAKLRVEGYGQAGGVLRRGLFLDAAARVTTSDARFRLGIGGWTGAQRDARRLDIGPTVALALPVAGRGVRLTLDWRHRIAGNARPGSGPVLSIGGDF